MVEHAPGRKGETGQTMAEYAVILGVVTPSILLALALLSGSVQSRIEAIVGLLGGVFS